MQALVAAENIVCDAFPQPPRDVETDSLTLTPCEAPNNWTPPPQICKQLHSGGAHLPGSDSHAAGTRAALGLWLRTFVGLAAAARSLQAVDPAAVGPEATAHLLTAMVCPSAWPFAYVETLDPKT